MVWHGMVWNGISGIARRFFLYFGNEMRRLESFSDVHAWPSRSPFLLNVGCETYAHDSAVGMPAGLD
jgi:hypothetical protein